MLDKLNVIVTFIVLTSKILLFKHSTLKIRPGTAIPIGQQSVK